MAFLSEVTRSTSGTVLTAAASDKTGKRPDATYIGWAAVLLIAGFFGGWGLTEVLEPSPFRPVEGIGMFAVFYAVAQALERLFEFTRLVFPNIGATKEGGQTKNKEDAEQEAQSARANVIRMVAEGDREAVTAAAQEAAAKLETVNTVNSNTALIAWTANAFIAALACGALGLFFLNAIGVRDVPVAVDVAVSSLIVGGGTKPLHDLIKNIEKAKDDKKT